MTLFLIRHSTKSFHLHHCHHRRFRRSTDSLKSGGKSLAYRLPIYYVANNFGPMNVINIDNKKKKIILWSQNS